VFLLLRKLLQLRTAHLPRFVAWEQLEGALERVQRKVIDAANDILNLDLDEKDNADTAVTLQMVLPHRCGGLGLLAHSQSTIESAYLSSAALTETSLQEAHPAFLPFPGPSGQHMQDAFESVQNELAETNGVELPPLSLGMVLQRVPGLQTESRRMQDQALFQLLKNKFQNMCDDRCTAEQISLARLHSVMDSGASKFMDAMPFCIFVQMNDHQFKSGVWNSLGHNVGPVSPG
jgi:hypothetical protein